VLKGVLRSAGRDRSQNALVSPRATLANAKWGLPARGRGENISRGKLRGKEWGGRSPQAIENCGSESERRSLQRLPLEFDVFSAHIPEADLNEAARAADAFACMDASVGNYPLKERMAPEVR